MTPRCAPLPYLSARRPVLPCRRRWPPEASAIIAGSGRGDGGSARVCPAGRRQRGARRGDRLHAPLWSPLVRGSIGSDQTAIVRSRPAPVLQNSGGGICERIADTKKKKKPLLYISSGHAFQLQGYFLTSKLYFSSNAFVVLRNL